MRNEVLSPCKLKYAPFILFGHTISSYECAPKTEQLNIFPNLECATVKQKRPFKSGSKETIMDVGIGCELKFTKDISTPFDQTDAKKDI